MAIQYYQKGSRKKLSENFRVREFQCPCGKCGKEFPIDEKLVEQLQMIRDHFGASVHISSAYRCEDYNASAGGSAKSNHKKGMAADIWVDGYLKDPRTVARYAESVGMKGIGLYEGSKGMWFVHIDSRDKKFYWESHENTPVDSFFPAEDKKVQLEVRVLKKGAKGEDVKALQRLLNGHGYELEPDGSFGGATEKALKDYQQLHDLETDGSCGRATWSSLMGGG